MTNITINSILLLVVLAVIATVHSRAVAEIRTLWMQQKIATERFSCQPRPRRFRASSLIDELSTADILPWETILHRCDAQSGCCNSPELECAEKESETVKLAFFSYDVNDILVYEAKNHTSCYCKSINLGAIKK